MKTKNSMAFAMVFVVVFLATTASLATSSKTQAYMGWWQIDAALKGAIPFEYIEIHPEDGGSVYLYEPNGKLFMNGVLTQKSAGVELTFHKQDSFDAELSSTAKGDRKLLVTVAKNAPKVAYTYVEKAPFVTKRPLAYTVDDAGKYLWDTLGKQLQGKATRETGSEEIEGADCKTFAAGDNTPERFVTTAHYAVCAQGEIYEMDVVAGTWQLKVPHAKAK